MNLEHTSNAPTWSVTYKYDGGACTEFIQAHDAETACKELMSRAKPTWNPGAECKLAGVHRILYFHELSVLPHRGLETAVDLTWDRRDKGGRYLVIERGTGYSPEGRDYWTTVGRIVRSVDSAAAGAKLVQGLALDTRKRGYSAQFDLVPRDAVKLAESGLPYGCMTRSYFA